MLGANFANQMADTILQMKMMCEISVYKKLVKSGDIERSRCDELTLSCKASYADQKIAMSNLNPKGDSDEGV